MPAVYLWGRVLPSVPGVRLALCLETAHWAPRSSLLDAHVGEAKNPVPHTIHEGPTIFSVLAVGLSLRPDSHERHRRECSIESLWPLATPMASELILQGVQGVVRERTEVGSGLHPGDKVP